MTLRIKGKLISNWTGSIRGSKKRPDLEIPDEDSLLSIEEKIKRRWISAYHELSLSLDVINVLSQTKIYQQGSIIYEPDKSVSQVHRLQDFINSIMTAIESDPTRLHEVQMALQQAMETAEGGLHEKFHHFLVTYDHKNSLIDVLKCLSTDIFSPASSQLKTAIFEKHPFSPADELSKYTIRLDGSKVEVVLMRTENSLDDNPERSFSFIWETRVGLDLNLGVDSLRAQIKITGMEFGDSMKALLKRELRELFEPFVDEVGAYLVLWQRAIGKHPVHKDIARLSKNITIMDADEKILFQDPEQKFPGRYSVEQILRILAQALNDKPVLEALDRFDESIKDQGDLSEQILKFFQLPAFSQDSPVVKVLKCITQEMIYPAVQTIRNLLYEKHPYKDVKGGWQVVVVLDPSGVSVTHFKREQSHESSPFAYGFQWRLRLAFDLKMETLLPTLNIIDFDWSQSVPEDVKAEITHLTYSIIDTDALYRQISQKTFSQLPVVPDLIEILGGEGFSILDHRQNEVFTTSKELEPRKNFLKFFTQLALAVDGSKLKDTISKKFKKLVAEESQGASTGVTSGLREGLQRFLDSEVIPAKSNTMKIIKSLRSEVVTPAFRQMRRSFPQDIPITQVPLSWGVSIVLRKKHIILCHSKRERGSIGGEFFEFTWSSSFYFDQAMDPLGSDLKVVDSWWDKGMREESKRKLRLLWAPYVEFNGLDAATEDYAYLPYQDLISAVCHALDRQPEYLVPSQYSRQLKLLATSLRNYSTPLVVVPTRQAGDQ